MILMVFMAASLLKSLRNEQRQMELHEAIMRERIQRLLDDSEREASSEESADTEEDSKPH